MRKVFGILAALNFIFLIGIAGALDCDAITPAAALVKAAIHSCFLFLFAYLAGAFSTQRREK